MSIPYSQTLKLNFSKFNEDKNIQMTCFTICGKRVQRRYITKLNRKNRVSKEISFLKYH